MVQKYFHDMVEAGCDAVVMEVSSQGLMLHRTQGFVFDFGIFTNIEPDHIGPNVLSMAIPVSLRHTDFLKKRISVQKMRNWWEEKDILEFPTM